ncbi:MAG TPA: glycoside hydrolase family 3 N-terminal domain-containing protein, partial [Paludibacter sp.]|nr:glycoside hydrolase family 3 N-terminal domain-containing protein [Paludibacter sp.]
MNKLRSVFFLLFLFFVENISAENKNINSSPSDRASQLLAQMSLGEKIAQLKNCSYDVIKSFVDVKGNVNTDSLKKYFPYGIGEIGLSWSLEPTLYVKIVNQLRNYNKSLRINIPPLFIGEGLHGYMANGATVFPQAIALGCSWDPVLLEKIFTATALEASARGVKQLFSPVLDLAREPRFGRTEEMYSEDAYLAAMCGQSAVWGFQGRNGMPDENHVAATLKHFVGHGQPEGGRNVAPINISKYDLMNSHMLPFEKCIQAGALSIMPSYNEMNGQPNHASKWLLNDILRSKLGFRGLITADQDALREMYKTHQTVSTLAEAAKVGIENGIAIDLRYNVGAYDELENLVETGGVNIASIDDLVLKVLTLKYLLGLFDTKDIDEKEMLKVTNSQAHKALALEAAHKSIVLLKNQKNTLPLDAEKLKTVAIIGPLAKGVHFGGYTAEPRKGIDVFEGIKNFAGNKFQVVYAEGCKLALEESSFWENGRQTPNSSENEAVLIKEAVETASKSDVVVLALGETESFSREAWSDEHTGDRESLDLLGNQNKLVETILQTGKPVVVLMFGGRPLSFNQVAQTVPAIIQVFYPGQEGGTAIADVLFGKVNPSGKLSVTIPKSVGQLPCYYSRKRSRMREYVGGVATNKPLYPFGFGLSYTQFEYSNLTIDKKEISKNQSIKVT